MFSLSVCVVIVLVVAEITTQRRKAGKSCCGFPQASSSPPLATFVDATELDAPCGVEEGGDQLDASFLVEEGGGGGGGGGGDGVGAGLKDQLDYDESDYELEIFSSSSDLS
eukprot:TRINITY_DN5483_c0_g1_i1.p2 TRINITY_DN5483_c0_g1~~TRINITY_DN5483_c0_g1_i1.p2  ORF type:complete len:111 (+),score=60.27 TRINITY_DN5483_c0_g1_i1:442-774(+)